ncbi:hypothetical protein ACB094_07G056700 [Castanea mollissima]
MVGSIEDVDTEKIEPLPEYYFDPTAVINEPVVEKSNGDKREIVVGRNVHSTCLAVTEPDADDELTGDREAHMASVLARYMKSLLERTKHHLGYPYNLDFDYGALAQLQHFSINNLGDPFIESNYGVHSRQFEVGVLDWFARLCELEKNEYWGYITNCGTEGNLHGILVGREVFADGILYASCESHYSVFKAAQMYRMECIKVETLVSGEIDCEDFKSKLLCHRDKPAIINLTHVLWFTLYNFAGTTVKGAVDDLDLVIQKLEEAGFTHDSVSVSGHKFVGCPMPCGVQITRLEHINALSRDVEYLASRDAMIMGYRGFQKEVQKCLSNAHYLKDRLISAGIGAMLNELSSTVVFECPQDDEFIRKWQLACQGNIAHVVVMPNITIDKLDDFLNELVQKRAAWFQDGKLQPPCIASDVGKENCLCALHK